MLMLLPGSTGIAQNLPYSVFLVLLSVILSSEYFSSGRVL